MPRYFLHLRDGTDEVLDPDGLMFDDEGRLRKAVVQNAPLDTKGDAVEFTIPKSLEQNVISVLNSLESSGLTCVRNGD